MDNGPSDLDRYLTLATVVAQVVPVLVLAAVAVPLRVASSAITKRRALTDLAVTSILLGLAGLTEVVALFGVFRPLGPDDRVALMWLTALVGLLTAGRLLTPGVRLYADRGGIPVGRVWAIICSIGIVAFVSALFLLDG